MKRIFAAIAVGATLVTAIACHNNADQVALENARLQHYKDSVKLASDTAGFGQYQAWKAQNEIVNQPQYPGQQNYAAAPHVAPTRTIVKYYPVHSSSSVHRSSSSSNGAYSGSSGSTASAPAKKGWSKAAKGAVIGGVGGAAAGAIINGRNRAAGAVIGGILGAGVGYGIGRGKDKKDGRY
jgi:hypothetical protein